MMITLFSSDLMLSFVYEMMKLISKHAKTGTPGFKGGKGGDI